MDVRITQITYSEQETVALGERLGRVLKGGELLALCGELGSGKTIFTKGIAKGLNVQEVLTSSSFVLASTYQGRLNLHHLDFYRLQEMDDFFSIGFDDFLSPDSVVVIEWAERFQLLLPTPYLKIELFIIDEQTREIIFSTQNNLKELLQQLFSER